ncbi:DUF2523 domain-containing protein [Luteimonas suaedae]|uniref:DUF2523 domain-containing protein n=1 Tax=Luteimonas suaedae TaxID=2605430 RepID=UPI0011EE39CD|nr:DUF2523 domain-containing protein [Luteimonas suaedae]
MPWLGALLTNLLGGSIATMLFGAGLALTTYAVSKPLILSMLTEAATRFNNIGGSLLQVMLIAGLGEVVTIIGSAILTRLGIQAARVMLVRRSA